MAPRLIGLSFRVLGFEGTSFQILDESKLLILYPIVSQKPYRKVVPGGFRNFGQRGKTPKRRRRPKPESGTSFLSALAKTGRLIRKGLFNVA